jgi:hypothetical protein
VLHYDWGVAMNFKLVVPIVLVGGVLLISGIQPTDLLDRGWNAWQAFTTDFVALFNGEGQTRIANEIKAKAGDGVQQYYVADPATTDADVVEIVNEVNRDLSKAEEERRTALVEGLKQRWKDQNLSIESLKQNLEEQKKLLE